MQYLLMIAIGLILIWSGYAIAVKAAEKKEREGAGAPEDEKSGIKKEKPERAAEEEPPVYPDSLDSAFAKENKLWVCRLCETINPDELESCAACGSPRKRS